MDNHPTAAASPAHERPSILSRLQRGIEALYRIETRLDVDAFVVDDETRARTLGETGGTQRRPREQLLVAQSDGDVSLGLFLDDEALANLERNDPAESLGDHNFGDFCLAVEGVSHFIYVAMCAARKRAVSELELELQAEVDKFASCVLLSERRRGTRALRARLYEDVRLHDDLDATERSRYQTANDQARRYAAGLEARYLRHGKVAEMVNELRWFYRVGLKEKLGQIARTAERA